MWSRTLLSSTFSYKSKANEEKTACQKVGRYDILPINGIGVTPAFVQYYYDTYCKKNEDKPFWNRAFGDNARCFTATLVCGNISNCSTGIDCFANVSNQTRCLYEAVDFKKCTNAQIAPLIADPSTPAPWGRCMGTCDKGVQIGDCLSGYGKRCVCNGPLPRFKDDENCKTEVPTVAAKSCQFGGYTLSLSSSPYYFEDTNWCIIERTTGKFNGSKCITEDGGSTFTKSVKDRTGVCVNSLPTIASSEKQFTIPKNTCGANHDKWIKDKTHCDLGKGNYITYGNCTADKQYICRCDDAGKYTYPTLRNNPTECP